MAADTPLTPGERGDLIDDLARNMTTIERARGLLRPMSMLREMLVEFAALDPELSAELDPLRAALDEAGKAIAGAVTTLNDRWQSKWGVTGGTPDGR